MRRRLSPLTLLSLVTITLGAPSSLSAQKTPGEAINSAFSKHNREEEPGCVVAVWHQGKTDHLGAYGTKDIETGELLATDTPFYIGSTSKQFTAACIFVLQSDGKIQLDDKARKYIPELPAFMAEITIAQLVYHRSGLRDFYELAWLKGEQFDTMPDNSGILEWVTRQEALNFKPGSAFLYCNTGYILLSLIIERVSQQSIHGFAAKRLFAPLGMKNTRFVNRPELRPEDAATGHESRKGKISPQPKHFTLTGPGGIFSTAEDLLLWGKALNGNHIPGAATKALTRLPDLDRNQPESYELGHYAAGIMLRTQRGERAFCHGGRYAGFRAELLSFPDSDLVIAVLANTSQIDPVASARRIADLYLKERSSDDHASDGTTTTATVANCRYIFRNTATGQTIGFGVRGGRGKLDILGSPVMLTPTSATTFESTTTRIPVKVELNKTAKDTSLSVSVGDKKPTVYSESLALSKVAADTVRELDGTYHSAELNSDIHLKEQGGRLAIDDRKLLMPIRAFIPINPDFYVSPSSLMLEVIRDASGGIKELRVSTARAWRIRFVPKS